MKKTPENDPSLAAIEEIYRFESWYYQQLAYYACDAGGKATPEVGRIRKKAIATFSDMLVRLLEIDWERLRILLLIFDGYREFSEQVTEIPDRRVLLRLLLREPAKRLEAFGILDSSGE